MAQQAKRRATDDDVLAAPSHMVAIEIDKTSDEGPPGDDGGPPASAW
jgi:hypothetical protein